MTRPIWRWIAFTGAGVDGNSLKNHAVPASLERSLLADLVRRGHGVEHTSKSIRQCFMDQPGPVVSTRPNESFELPGLELVLPSEDCADFAGRLQRMEQRTFEPFPGRSRTRPYYKLHSWLRCLVLTPTHYRSLLAQVTARLVDAENRARAFYLERMPTSQILREASAIASHVPVEQVPPEILPTDRFYPKQRGEA